MDLQVCVLASGSSGNSTYIASNTTRILVDAGLSARQTAVRLAQIGAAPESIRGICVSHEHGDHVAGLRILQKRHGIPIYANAGTLGGIRKQPGLREISAKVFQTGAPFNIGEITIEPFCLPHDACEPVGFRLQNGGTCVGIITDLGMPTTLIREKLKGCQVLVVEANHDEDMLREASRPWPLKQRIRSRQGHLSNMDAARLIAESATDALEHVFLAHLSTDCNTPEIALRTVSSQLRLDGIAPIGLEVSYPDRISSIWKRKRAAQLSTT